MSTGNIEDLLTKFRQERPTDIPTDRVKLTSNCLNAHFKGNYEVNYFLEHLNNSEFTSNLHHLAFTDFTFDMEININNINHLYVRSKDIRLTASHVGYMEYFINNLKDVVKLAFHPAGTITNPESMSMAIFDLSNSVKMKVFRMMSDFNGRYRLKTSNALSELKEVHLAYNHTLPTQFFDFIRFCPNLNTIHLLVNSAKAFKEGDEDHLIQYIKNMNENIMCLIHTKTE